MWRASLNHHGPITPGVLASGTLLATGWQALRVAGQLLWVVLVARLLGPEEYGTLAGLMALATALGTLTGLGLGLSMLLDVPRDPDSFGGAWTRALWACVGSGAVLVATYVVAAPWLTGLETSWPALSAIAVSEVVCFPTAVLCSYAFQAHDRMGWAHAIYAIIPAASLAALAAFAALQSEPTLESYVAFHVVAVLSATVLLHRLVRWKLQPAASRFQLHGPSLRRGLELSAVRAADVALNTLDKTLLLRIGGGEMAGVYAVATRLASALALPLVTLTSVALPHLTRSATTGGLAERRLIGRLLMVTLLWGAVAAAGMAVLSGLLPVLLGPGFRAASDMALRLSALPLLMGLCSLGCTVLLTAHRQRLRLGVQTVGIGILMASAYALIPRHGLDGAAAMVLIAQSITAAGLWIAIRATRSPPALPIRGSH